MPFTALDMGSGERIDITQCENPKAELSAKSLACPICSDPMIVRAGLVRVAHFAHRTGSDCIYAQYAAGESPEHRFLKLWWRDYLRTWFLPQFNVDLQLEYHVREANRIADVAAIFPNGCIHLFEIQLAGITTGTLSERTRDYERAGCDVTWILGGQADTLTNRAWVQSYQEEALLVTLESGEVEDNVSIDQDCRNFAAVPGGVRSKAEARPDF